MNKLAEAIAHEEGFYVLGSLPNRQNNPGDLRHGNGEVHPDNQPDAVGSFPTPEAGWAALNRQLVLDSSNTSFGQRANWTVRKLVYTYNPPGVDNNDPDNYLAYVCEYVGCTPDTLVSEVLKS